MHHIGAIAETTLKVEVDKQPVVFLPGVQKVVVQHKLGEVYLFLGGRGVKMNTLTAHKIGYTIAMAVPKLAPNEMIVLFINGERLELLAGIAQNISTALLRKADDADDWQLAHRRH